MFRSIWILSIYVRAFMRRCMPTNVILNLIRRRQGLKWGVPAMALAIPYLLIAFWCVNFTAAGGPGWVNFVTLLALWNMMKFIAIGPASLVLLFRCRRYEARERRLSDAQLHSEDRVVVLSH